MVEMEYEVDSTGNIINNGHQWLSNADELGPENEQTSEIQVGARNADMAHDSQEEESKDGGRADSEDDTLLAKMKALALEERTEQQNSGKKKKPRKKKKGESSVPNENSIAGRTRGKIAEFMKAHP